MLRAIDIDLWVAEQPLKYFGLEIGTRMMVIRLNHGELVVISPIRPTAKTIHPLNELGTVRYIIAPNLYHHLFLSQFKQHYPEAELWATSGLEHKRPDLVINQVLSEPDTGCTITLFNEIKAAHVTGFNTLDIKGCMPLNEWVFLHTKSRTLIMTDLAFHFDRSNSVITQWVAKLFGNYQQLRPSPLEKLATRDKQQVWQSIQAILAWDFERVIMAHGSIVERDGKRQFQLGYNWFLHTGWRPSPTQ